MNSGSLIYRCRRCGTVYGPTHTRNIAEALSWIVVEGETPKEWGTPARRLEVHHCGGRNLGIADVIGGQEDHLPDDPVRSDPL